MQQVNEKRDFFHGCSKVLEADVPQWELEPTEPRFVNGEWESVYKPKIPKRTFNTSCMPSADYSYLQSRHRPAFTKSCYLMSMTMPLKGDHPSPQHLSFMMV
jgi:hypothetical protein